MEKEIDVDNPILDMLEELLSITEPFKEKMDSEKRKVWERISARTADIRSGEEL